MDYALTTPCSSCPFRRDVRFFLNPGRTREIASSLSDHGSGHGGTFPCHKTVEYRDSDGEARMTSKSQFCAGALIVMEKSTGANQMMRVAERLGLYDPAKLNMDAPVFDSLEEFARQRPTTRGERVKKPKGTGLYCKDCGREVLAGPPDAKFPYGCADCGNKTRKDVTNRKPTSVDEPMNAPRKAIVCKADREDKPSSDHKLTFKEDPPKPAPHRGPTFSVTEITVSKADPLPPEPLKPALLTREGAQDIFTRWWKDGVLKAELKPVKVLKVIYAMVEENADELRIKVVALCRLENGEKRRMSAKKYQRRSQSEPHFCLVETTKKPDGDELFDDTYVGRDEFARRMIARYEAQRASAADKPKKPKE